MLIPEKIFSIQNKSDFQALALEIFRFQSENVPVYKEFISHLKIQPEKIKDITDIPFLPVELFKSHEIITQNKKAEIIDFCIIENKNITNNLVKERQFLIKMKVFFKCKIEEPIFAFTIKNLKGVEITGTNTMIEKVDLNIVDENECKEITFKQVMNLQGGQYLLSLGCTGYVNGEFTVYHRLYDICDITVISDKNTVGYYDMNSDVQLV